MRSPGPDSAWKVLEQISLQNLIGFELRQLLLAAVFQGSWDLVARAILRGTMLISRYPNQGTCNLTYVLSPVILQVGFKV